MKILKTGTPEFQETMNSVVSRRQHLMDEFSHETDEIIKRYRQSHERCLLEIARQYDQVTLTENELWISEEEIKNSHKKISSELRQTIENVKKRIERFQKELKTLSFHSEEEAGIFWGTEVRALDRVGIYVPGGRASYFITLILCAVSARLAGVKEIIVATAPKRRFGAPYVEPSLLYAAKLMEIQKILVAGGPAALAALAFGTKKTANVQMIVGGGSRRTMVAKQRLSGYVGIDGLTGPLEMGFICDKLASPKQVALEMIGRADHDPEAEIFIFHQQEKWIETLMDELTQGINNIKDRDTRATVDSCMQLNTYCFLVKNLEEAFSCINEIAPAVLCLRIEGASDYVKKVKTCGTVLLGPYTPPVALDLIGGASGVVKTHGTSQFSRLLTPDAFTHQFSSLEFSRGALKRYEDASRLLSLEEGFVTHGLSYKISLESES